MFKLSTGEKEEVIQAEEQVMFLLGQLHFGKAGL